MVMLSSVDARMAIVVTSPTVTCKKRVALSKKCWHGLVLTHKATGLHFAVGFQTRSRWLCTIMIRSIRVALFAWLSASTAIDRGVPIDVELKSDGTKECWPPSGHC